MMGWKYHGIVSGIHPSTTRCDFDFKNKISHDQNLQ